MVNIADMRIVTLGITILLFCNTGYTQTPGCMDIQAQNYDPAATVNNGSCIYANTSLPLVQQAQLPAVLSEISGMEVIGSKLYAHNDGITGTPNVLYRLDTTDYTRIEQIIFFEGIDHPQKDWEDLTRDDTHMYIGDFGNNVNGNRSNLRIYKFPLSLLGTDAPEITIPGKDIQVIQFSYADQTDFTPKGSNNTGFDCEAFFYHDGFLHLFTKNWTGNNSAHYIIPAAAGTQIAQRLGTLDTRTPSGGNILITGATMMNDNTVLLLGYGVTIQQLLPCGVWMISGFGSMEDLSTNGNKRYISLGSVAQLGSEANSRGQVEAIAAVNPAWAHISNEHFHHSLGALSVEVPQKIYGFSILPVIPQQVLPFGIERLTARVNDDTVSLSWESDGKSTLWFEVEVSFGDDSYQYVGKVEANQHNAYSYTDTMSSGERSRTYRIRGVRADNSSYYSNIIRVKPVTALQADLSAYPVPFTSSLTVNFNSQEPQELVLRITDISGRVVKTEKLQFGRGNYSYIISDLNFLPKGMYILSATAKQHLHVVKLMRE